VARAASPASRRAVSVRLTAAGHELVEATVSQLLGHQAEPVGALTPPRAPPSPASLAKLEQALTGS
jgi:hypothetical protein